MRNESNCFLTIVIWLMDKAITKIQLKEQNNFWLEVQSPIQIQK